MEILRCLRCYPPPTRSPSRAVPSPCCVCVPRARPCAFVECNRVLAPPELVQGLEHETEGKAAANAVLFGTGIGAPSSPCLHPSHCPCALVTVPPPSPLGKHICNSRSKRSSLLHMMSGEIVGTEVTLTLTVCAAASTLAPHALAPCTVPYHPRDRWNCHFTVPPCVRFAD